MICSVCGTENRPDRRFCRQCGSSLAATCPSCGAANEADDRFCGACGSPLSAAPQGPAVPPATSPPGPGQTPQAPVVTERRLVSVLFADLVGFTGLSDERDPEAVRELLARYFEIARDRIERYGGTIEKFIGDAVMAVWGTPVAQEDDAERAVRAALELVDAMPTLQAAAPLDRDGAAVAGGALRLRAAVLTGEAAVTIGAVGQGMVAGDLVNTASRLQAAAGPGEVLVGEATHRAASSAIVFEPVGEQFLRGKALPVRAWRAVRVVAGRKGAGRTERLEPPFVGRDDELRLLKELLHATARENRARLVSVTGVAGIGKSRLTWELEKYVDGLVETIYWHQGRSPSYGGGVGFRALGEMVRQRARIAETDGPDESRGRLRSALEEYVAGADEQAWIEPRLAVLLGLEAAPPGEREELFAAWRKFFERISERGPVVLVFEELQWADDGLLDFIESVLEWSRARPILVLTLARPDLLERRPTWGAGQRSFTSLHLEPLPPAAMELLLVGLAPGIPQPLIRSILDRSEGIPLYAVEMVRMLLDRGRLVEREGRYHLLGALDELAELSIPESLHALIGARIDGLTEAERSLLQEAALLGQSVRVDALVDLSGQPREEVDALLRQLARKELLVLDVDPRSPERGQYHFVQALIREVAYGRLNRRERQQRHLAAARYFERIADPELAGVVASHYLHAHRAAQTSADAAELGGHAVRALTAAARRATDLHNHAQALAFLQQALEIEPDAEDRVRLREQAAESAFAADRADVARPLFHDLVDWYRARGDPRGVARATTRLAPIVMWDEDEGPAAAVRLLEAAEEELAAVAGSPEFVRLDAELARALLMAGDFERASAMIDRALVTAERLDLRETIAELLASKGWVSSALGRTREGIALLQGASVFCETHGFINAFLRCCMNLSAIGTVEDPRAAMEAARRGMATAQRLGYQGWVSSAAGNLGWAAFLAGEWDESLRTVAGFDREEFGVESGLEGRFNLAGPAVAVTAFREGAEAARRRLAAFAPLANSPSPQARGFLAEIESHVAFAAGELEQAYEHASPPEDPLWKAETAALAGRAALWLRDRGRVRTALARIDETGMHGRRLDAVRATLEAGLAALEGRADEAGRRYDEAERELEAVGARYELALALTERAVFGPTSDAAVAAARAALERLGARVLLERLEAATAGVGGSPEAAAPRAERG